jgi:hypothetical protein
MGAQNNLTFLNIFSILQFPPYSNRHGSLANCLCYLLSLFLEGSPFKLSLGMKKDFAWTVTIIINPI